MDYPRTETSTLPTLPSIERLTKDLYALTDYTDYIDGHLKWSTYYYRYANHLRRLFEASSFMELSTYQRWEYQQILLEYLRKAQQQAPSTTKIAFEISLLLHRQCPADIIAQEYAQEVIGNYLIAAHVPDPAVPMSSFAASYCYIGLADFYRDVLQQALSAHYYYKKSLHLAPNNDQAKLEWAKLLEREGAFARAEALRATVAADYEAPLNGY